MMTFRGEKLKNFAIPAGSVWLMTDIAQSKRQEPFPLNNKFREV